MGRDLKHQVGARVDPDLLARAKAAAARIGVSFNEWVANAFRRELAAGETPGEDTMVAHAQPIPGQLGIPVVTDEAVEPGTMLLRDQDGNEVARLERVGPLFVGSVGEPQPFAPNCIAQTLHWRHGPGNPCKSCRGEI